MDLKEQIEWDRENIVPPPKRKELGIEYGILYILEGEWTFECVGTGYNLIANTLIEALNFMAREGWEYVSSFKSDNLKHVLVKR